MNLDNKSNGGGVPQGQSLAAKLAMRENLTNTLQQSLLSQGISPITGEINVNPATSQTLKQKQFVPLLEPPVKNFAGMAKSPLFQPQMLAQQQSAGGLPLSGLDASRSSFGSSSFIMPTNNMVTAN